jgi:hypothetical protein
VLEQILRATSVLRFVVLERDKAWFYALWNLPGRIDPIEARGRKQQRE